jgi:membrane protein DedA with SNARE-associated domain
MVLYSLISILIWNGMIVFTAAILGKNWQDLYRFLLIYNRIVLTLVVGAIIVGLIYYFVIKKRKANIQNAR